MRIDELLRELKDEAAKVIVAPEPMGAVGGNPRVEAQGSGRWVARSLHVDHMVTWEESRALIAAGATELSRPLPPRKRPTLSDLMAADAKREAEGRGEEPAE